MSRKSSVTLRQIIRKLLADSTTREEIRRGRGQRTRLRGSVRDRTAAVENCSRWLKQLESTPDVAAEKPDSRAMCVWKSRMRATASNEKLSATLRESAIRLLCRVEKVEGVPVEDTPDDTFVSEQIGYVAPAPEMTSTVDNNEKTAFLCEVRECLIADIADGTVANLDDAVRCLHFKPSYDAGVSPELARMLAQIDEDAAKPSLPRTVPIPAPPSPMAEPEALKLAPIAPPEELPPLSREDELFLITTETDLVLSGVDPVIAKRASELRLRERRNQR